MNILTERVKAGTQYFLKEQGGSITTITTCNVVTDSRTHAKEFNEVIKEIFTRLALKKHLLEGFSGKFDIATYHQRKKNFVLPSLNVNVYAGATSQPKSESPHPILHQRLRKLRDSICSKGDIPIYIVAGSTTLDEMSRFLPQDLSELRKISGFGDAKTEKYGRQFLEIIVDYCKERNLSSRIHEKVPKRERKTEEEKKNKANTKAESLRLFKEGKNIDDIAKERNLTKQTIEEHLAHYVSLGEINVKDLISDEKLKLIEQAAKNFSGSSKYQ